MGFKVNSHNVISEIKGNEIPFTMQGELVSLVSPFLDRLNYENPLNIENGVIDRSHKKFPQEFKTDTCEIKEKYCCSIQINTNGSEFAINLIGNVITYCKPIE